jgi:hypothetical protein
MNKLTVILCLAFLTQATLAAEKKKPAKAENDSQSLFDAIGGSVGESSGGLNDLRHATDTVGPASSPNQSNGLAIKKNRVVGDGKVTVKKVFAAKRIVIKKGKCEAVPVRVKYFTASDFPLKVDAFGVCAVLEGGANRAMRMSVIVTTGRGKMIGSAESIADFTGKRRLEHAIDFPPLQFPEAGVYRYIIEIEGERIANLPLFEVRSEKDVVIPE